MKEKCGKLNFLYKIIILALAYGGKIGNSNSHSKSVQINLSIQYLNKYKAIYQKLHSTHSTQIYTTGIITVVVCLLVS